MRVCVLQSGAANTVFDGIDPECSPAPYLPGHEVVNVTLDKATVATQLTALAKQGFDVFVNLCDGAWDEDRAGLEVVALLEKLDVPYTGAGAFLPSLRAFLLSPPASKARVKVRTLGS